MRNIIREYKEELKKLLSKKGYLFSIIIVCILAYGYAITHVSIGMDDTCLDRYYGSFFSENMASAGRWGSYILYKILGITNFTPFWLEFLTVLVIMSTCVLISCFIRKNIKKQDVILSTIFSCIYISYPLINEPFIFQPSNLALFLSNLLTIACVIGIFEIIDNNLKKKYYFFFIPILAISISMYESCCQTFLVGLLACMIVRIILKKEQEKNLFKNFFTGIGVLVASILLNYVILKIFYAVGIPNQLSGGRSIYWFEYGISNGITVIAKNIWYYTVRNIRYFPVLEFIISIALGLILSIYLSIKNKNIYIFNIYILMIFANFALSILQCREVLYRANTSWGLMVAMVITLVFALFVNRKYLKTIAIISITLIILWQTKDMNQWFYSEYLKYQRDLKDAYQIADDITKKVESLKKPVVFCGIPNKEYQLNGQIGAQSNGLSVIWWGAKAFDDNAYELIKFINSLGYHFRKPTNEQYQKGKQLSEQMPNYPKEGYIKEYEDIIVVHFN